MIWLKYGANLRLNIEELKAEGRKGGRGRTAEKAKEAKEAKEA
jgi:hypothetical protein